MCTEDSHERSIQVQSGTVFMHFFRLVKEVRDDFFGNIGDRDLRVWACFATLGGAEGHRGGGGQRGGALERALILSITENHIWT